MKKYNLKDHIQCVYFLQGECHSCDFLDRTPEEVQAEKIQKLRELFPAVSILPFENPEHFFGSRQKAKLAAFLDESNGDQIGLGIYDFKKKLDLSHCPLYSKKFQKLILKTKDFLKKQKVIPYNIVEKKGEIKFVIINEDRAFSPDEKYMVRLVLRSKESLDRIKKAAEVWLLENNEIATLSVNFQPEHKAVIEGAEEILIAGDAYLPLRFREEKLLLGAKSFSQVSLDVAYKLYHYVGNILREKKIKKLLDLYCGVGGFSFFAAKYCEECYGIEISSEAVVTANKAKILRSLSNVHFECSDAKTYLQKKNFSFDAVVVNPPRNGLDTTSVEIILEEEFPLLIYSSCQVDTLKRDHERLSTKYQLVSLKPFDMFAQSKHFEVVAHYQLR